LRVGWPAQPTTGQGSVRLSSIVHRMTGDDDGVVHGGMSSPSLDLGVPGCDVAEEIGRGGYARVYRAVQRAFDRQVAIKVMSEAVDDGTLSRFRRECLAIGGLSGHPNIVSVYDHGMTKNGRPYLVMEFLAGGSMASWLEGRGPLPWSTGVEIAVKLAGALESAHRAGVLHRDVKPENVLMSRFGEPKLADFGIARVDGHTVTRTGVVTTTVAHAPPEILDAKAPTIRSDIYSLGSTLFAFLAGHAPFVGPDNESIYALIARIGTEPPPDLRLNGVPHAVAVAVERCLEKRPDDRPSSAAHFGRELQAAQAAAGFVVTQMPLEASGRPEGRPDQGTTTQAPPPADSTDAHEEKSLPTRHSPAGTDEPTGSPPRKGQTGSHLEGRRRWPLVAALSTAVVAVAAVGALAFLRDSMPHEVATATEPVLSGQSEGVFRSTDASGAFWVAVANGASNGMRSVARWTADVDDGVYRVEVFVPSQHARATDVTYTVKFDDGLSQVGVPVDQSQTRGWVELGSYAIRGPRAILESSDAADRMGEELAWAAARWTRVGSLRPGVPSIVDDPAHVSGPPPDRLTDSGYEGDLTRTRAGPDAGATTVVRWEAPSLPSGTYRIDAYLPGNHTVGRTRYSVNVGTTTAGTTINQAIFGEQWITIGTFALPVGSGSVSASQGDGTTPGEEIAFDAIRWTRIDWGVAP